MCIYLYIACIYKDPVGGEGKTSLGPTGRGDQVSKTPLGESARKPLLDQRGSTGGSWGRAHASLSWTNSSTPGKGRKCDYACPPGTCKHT